MRPLFMLLLVEWLLADDIIVLVILTHGLALIKVALHPVHLQFRRVTLVHSQGLTSRGR